MTNEKIKFLGTIEVFKNGTLIDTVKNLVVNTGLNFFLNGAFNGITSPMGYIAVGSGVTAPAPTNTALVTEIARQPLANTPGSQTIQLTASFLAGVGTGTIAEAGIFNASSGGTMLSRALIGPYTKAANDTIVLVWTINASAS